MAHEWRNWTGDQACAPAAIQHPRTLDGLIYAVRSAAERGSGDPCSRLGPLVHRRGADGWGDDPDRGAQPDPRPRPRVRPDQGRGGDHAADLSAALWEHGLAMENLGDIDKQTLAGAISTATHGTGARVPQPLGAGRGARVGAGRRKRARALRAIRPDRASGRAGRRRGARGRSTRVTLRAVPAFTMQRSTRRSRSSGPSRASTSSPRATSTSSSSSSRIPTPRWPSSETGPRARPGRGAGLRPSSTRS